MLNPTLIKKQIKKVMVPGGIQGGGVFFSLFKVLLKWLTSMFSTRMCVLKV